MKQIRLQEFECVHVLSDLHLRSPSDPRSQTLLAYLDGVLARQDQPQSQAQSQPQALFLLGDIFDFIYFPSSFHREFWKEVLIKFHQIKDSGIKIYFVEGNHDFGFELTLETNRYFTAGADFVCRFAHPKLGEVMLRHGDDVVCPPSYLWFRRLVKNSFFQRITALVPGRITYFLFSRYASLSRTKDKYRTLDPKFFTRCVNAQLTKETDETKIAVFGHVHVFVDQVLDQNTRVLVGPDWFAAPSILKIEKSGECRREWLTEKTAELFECKQ